MKLDFRSEKRKKGWKQREGRKIWARLDLGSSFGSLRHEPDSIGDSLLKNEFENRQELELGFVILLLIYWDGKLENLWEDG